VGQDMGMRPATVFVSVTLGKPKIVAKAGGATLRTRLSRARLRPFLRPVEKGPAGSDTPNRLHLTVMWVFMMEPCCHIANETAS
jgi:hypothetical protein